MTSVQTNIVGAVERLRAMIQGDGADLRLLAVDERAGTVELSLELDSAECADCVLPPQQLHDVLATSLGEVTAHRVVLHDPRVGIVAPAERPRIRVLDPTAKVATADRDPGPDAGELRGKTVVFRVDVLWQAWDWVVDEWMAGLTEVGAEVRSFRRTQGLAGADGEDADREYDRLLTGADAAIVGLGNCGSCTSWTIKDAVLPAQAGLPTVAVVTQQFAALAEMLSAQYGRPGLRTHVLPFPLQTRPEDEVRAIAREAFPAVLATLGATV